LGENAKKVFEIHYLRYIIGALSALRDDLSKILRAGSRAENTLPFNVPPTFLSLPKHETGLSLTRWLI